MITTASLTKNISLMTSFFAFVGGLMHLLTTFYPNTGYDIFDHLIFTITDSSSGIYLSKMKFDTLCLIIPGAVICGLGLIMMIILFMVDDGSVPLNQVKKSHEDGGQHNRSSNGILFAVMGFGGFILLVGLYTIFHSLMLSSSFGTTKYLAFVNKNIFGIKVVLEGKETDEFRKYSGMTYNLIGIYLIALFYYGSTLIIAGITGIIHAIMVKGEPAILELKKPEPQVIAVPAPVPPPQVVTLPSEKVEQPQTQPQPPPQPPSIHSEDHLPINRSENNSEIHSSINNSSINQSRNSQNSVGRPPMSRGGRAPMPRNGPPRPGLNQSRGGPARPMNGNPVRVAGNNRPPPTASNVIMRSRPANIPGGGRPRQAVGGPPRPRPRPQ